MKKHNTYIKLRGSTTYMPQVSLTKDELITVYTASRIPLAFLKQILIETNTLEDVIKHHEKGKKKDVEKAIREKWQNRQSELKDDLDTFSKGRLDVIDLVFKYGLPYKSVRPFLKEMLPETDVDTLWKMHKKHAQKKTTQALYGVEHTTLLDDVQQKRRQTTMARYGVENVMRLAEKREKLKQTMLQKYGVTHNFQKSTDVERWQKHLFKTLSQDASWKKIFTHKDIRNRQQFFEQLPLMRRDFIISTLTNTHVEDLLTWWLHYYNQKVKYPENSLFRLSFSFSSPWLAYYKQKGLLDAPSVYLNNNTSQYEKMIQHALNEWGISYLKGHRKLLNGLELDFYIPEKRIAIEVNPSSTHNSNRFALNSRRCMHHKTVDDRYHFDKYFLCQQKGVTLLQLYANDLTPTVFNNLTKPRLKDILCGRRKINGRQVIIKRASAKDVRAFLETYHTQGFTGSKAHYVMYHNDELIGVASFDTWQKKGAWELKRLAFKTGLMVQGGLSKIIKRFKRDHNNPLVYSYSDNNIGNGKGYESAGAVFIKETGPSLVFISQTDPTDRYGWQVATPWSAKSGIIAKDFGGQMTHKTPRGYVETELTHRTDDKKGYDAIYTAGSKLWRFD